MTDRELIKQEIKRQLYGGLYSIDAKATLQNLYTFIDTLPEEPVSEDLEEAANFYTDTHMEWFDSEGNPHVMPAFKAGAEWQKQRDKESSCEAETNCTPENDDLEKAASEYVREDFHERSRADFKAGAEWQKRQMMKDAVEGEEIWKSIVGFEEYEVSNKGRVLSRKQKKDGVFLTQQTNHAGYKYVTLRDENYRPHLELVHRLVAEAFIPNPNKKLTVNHKYENKGNNIVSNLEWATHLEQKNYCSQKRPDVNPSMLDEEGRQPRELIETRAYLRKCKYLIDDLNMIAYYDDNTHRSKKYETENKFYDYKPYNGESVYNTPFISRPWREVEVVSDNGIVTVYKNISQAAKALKVSVSLVKRRLDGIGGTSGNSAKLINYTFKYKEE